MVASRCPQRLRLAAFIRRSTSASVRYSRVRRSPLGSRVGLTVRLTVAGVTSFRCDLAIRFLLLGSWTVRILTPYRTVTPLQPLITLGNLPAFWRVPHIVNRTVGSCHCRSIRRRKLLGCRPVYQTDSGRTVIDVVDSFAATGGNFSGC